MKTERSQKKKSAPQSPYIEKLEKLGFSKAEGLIYVYLLEKGSEAFISKIAVATGMHRQQVYLVMPKLLEAGIVEEIREGKQSKYKARPPQHLERVIRRQMVLAEDAAKELQKISKIGNEQDFEVIIGEQAFRSYELQRSAALPEGSSQYILGVTSDKYMYITKDIQEEYTKNLKERGIKTYYLGGEAAPGIYETISYHFERRMLKGLSLQFMSIVVSEGQLAFYGNLEPITTYVIYSDKIAKDYEGFFKLLWEMAGEGK